jgi:hypothetical protein
MHSFDELESNRDQSRLIRERHSNQAENTHI